MRSTQPFPKGRVFEPRHGAALADVASLIVVVEFAVKVELCSKKRKKMVCREFNIDIEMKSS
jgi:hypothetical protein